jgi:hypothetical protein
VISDAIVLRHVWPELTGLRPSGAAAATSPARLHLNLLGDLPRIVDLPEDQKPAGGSIKTNTLN